MKKLLIALAVLSAPVMSAASPGSIFADSAVKTISPARADANARKPICNCAFDPETRTWTCTPKGCNPAGSPGSGLITPPQTDRVLPDLGRTQPLRR